MSYQVFALKYRPQNFEEVVGQKHVVSSLQKAISAGRVHHAYLFSGPRGVGKTSLARILAKALNCQEGPTPNPCLKCPSCVDIRAGKSLDIIEIDGASNRGIDEIRSLRENVKLSPAAGRFKVYIIDEVHMLTKEAFNALLKTLEEPPSHVKFIFATTDPHKVLPTILSRCQKFQFDLLSLEEIVTKLQEIAELEKLKIKDSLLYTIAQAGEGSIRDAESLLDQVFPVLDTGEDIKDIFSFLGIIDENTLNKLIGFIANADLSASLDFVDQIKKEGKDLGVFLDYLLKYLRNLLLVKIDLAKFKKVAQISPQSKDFLPKATAKLSLARILKLIDLLIKAKEISRQINSAHIPFELALIKFLYNEVNFEENEGEGKKQKIEDRGQKTESKEVEAQNQKDNPPQSGEISPKAEGSRMKRSERSERSPERPKGIKGDKEEEKQRDREVEKGRQGEGDSFVGQEGLDMPQEDRLDDILVQPVRMKWKEILAKMQKERMAIASHLSFGRPVASAGKQVFIAFPFCDKFHKETLDSDKSRIFIENSIKNEINKEVIIAFKLEEKKEQENLSQSQQEFKRPEDNKPKKREDDDFLNDLLDTFEGKFHNNE